MKYEPNKIMKGLEFTCFYPSLDGVLIKDPRTAYYLSGTPEAYKALIPFFENQIELCQQFDSATKAIVCRKPADFAKPMDVSGLKIEFAAEIKIKLHAHKGDSRITLLRKELTIETSVDDLKRAIEVCHQRQSNRAGENLEMLGFAEAKLISVPLGQWQNPPA